MFWVGVAVLVVSIIIKRLVGSQPAPIAGVYMQPGPIHRLKFWLFYILLKLRQKRNAKAKHVTGEQAGGYGVRSRNTVEDMEKAQELPKEHPMVI